MGKLVTTNGFIGNYTVGDTIVFTYNTYDSTDAAVTSLGGGITVLANGWQVSTGMTLEPDADGVTGLQRVTIDTSNTESTDQYARYSDYSVVCTDYIDGQNIRTCVASFGLRNRIRKTVPFVEHQGYIGVYGLWDYVRLIWSSTDHSGGSVDRVAKGSIIILRNGSPITIGQEDTQTFDSVTGLHSYSIRLLPTLGFVQYSYYTVVVSLTTIDSEIITAPLASFYIEYNNFSSDSRYDNAMRLVIPTKGLIE